MSNGHYVIPKLVEDASLKRARTEVEIGGETKDAIRVTSVGGSGGLDAQGVADAMATAPDATVDVSSVLGKIAQLNSNLSLMNNHLGEISEAVYDPEESGTLLDNVQNNTAYTYDTSINTGEINNTATAINTAIGSRTDTTSVNSMIGLTKSINNNVSALVFRGVGNYDATAWSGTGNGTLIAIAKRTSNDTNAAATATGAQSDAAWSGSGNATIIALLKGIYNKL